MPRLLPLLLLSALLLRHAMGASEIRVVSQTVGTDELLLAVAEPEQIAALSHLSRDRAFSGVAEEASKYPALNQQGDSESILRYRPTLVLLTDFSRAELRTQVSRAGVDTLVFDRYTTIEDAYGNLRALASRLGPEAVQRAERVIASCEQRIATLRRHLECVPPVKVIAPSSYGIIPGLDTTFQDLCEHAGADNLAWSLGRLHGHAQQPSEAMLTWPVERLVVAGTSLEEALASLQDLPPYRFMPSVQESRAVLIEPYQISCISHLRVNGYETLARALHPDCFK